jgi:hypothetical protein
MEQNRGADVKSTQTKTMTCRELGGPCDLTHRGEDANEIIKAQDHHLKEAVAAGNPDHEPALKEMKGRWKRPVSERDERAAAEARITKTIAELEDWRGDTLSKVRELIHEADPDVVEEVKWVKPSNPAGVPTWSHDGIICTGEIYKAKVKLTFFNGAALADPTGLFNSSLEGATRRAIDIDDDQEIDARAFKALVRDAVKLNTA